MTADLVKTILGSGGIVTLLIAIFGAIVKLVQNRSAKRAAERLNARQADDRDDDRVEDYRAGIETHVIEYDVPMKGLVLSLQSWVRQLWHEAGRQGEPTFEPLPPSRPIFQRRDDPKSGPAAQ